MQLDKTTVVIGAGPYGLSVAAHLKARGIPTLVFGKPMGFWQEMPDKMYLKSVVSASCLSDLAGKYSIYDYFREHNIPKEEQEPVPLPTFLKYGAWFQQNMVPDVDPTFVHHLAQEGQDFRIDLEDKRSVHAQRVIVATGVARFTHIPEYARHLPSQLAGHTQDHKTFDAFRGRKVVIVGCGQSGLETAALLHEAGAEVEIIVREEVAWIDRRMYTHGGPFKHLFYPPSDVGPPGYNWLIAFPQIYKMLPEAARHSIDLRAIRPAGATWLRTRVANTIHTTERTEITEASEQGDKVHLKLSDGTTREIDYLMLGTGYRAHLDKLPFIESHLRKQIQTRNGYPVLNHAFESSVPRLHIVGALASHTFGPICRFVSGSKAPALRIAQDAAASHN